MNVLTDKLPRDLKLSLEDIKSATKDFTTVIGTGGYGHVFKGELPRSGKITTVAVKRLQLNNNSGQGLKEFLTEIQLISRCRHSNIVSLVGFCAENKENVLVYEYASHGSLDKYIIMGQTSNPLTWKRRISICVDAACGLEYLHNSLAADERIIHRDIKSANILLDHNWKSMISDFGLSKLGRANVDETFVVTNACGTHAYLDPEYLSSGILTKESDVYSFGVVLFEVLCGRLAYGDRQLLGPLAKSSYEKGKLDDIIHPDLKKQMGSASLNAFSEIAYQCLHNERIKRPSIVEVVKKLEEAMEFQEHYEADKEREKGNHYFKQKKYADAIIHYTESLKMNPKDVKTYSNRAACYTELGSWREALNDAGTCIEIAPNFAKGYSQKGVIQFRMKEYAKALKTYNEGLKYEPLDDALLDGVKMCNQEIQRAACDHDPDSESAGDTDFKKGGEYFIKGKYPDAIRHYKTHLRGNPKDARAYCKRAACYRMLGQFSKGLKDIEMCIQLDPMLPHGYIEKSSILFDMSWYEEALETCQDGLKFHPRNEVLLEGVRRCLEQREDHKQELPDNEPGWAQRQRIFIQEITNHLRRNPEDACAYANRAFCYKMLGELKQGLMDAQKSIQVAPMLPYGYIEKSSILFNMTKYEEALETCQDGLKFQPQNEVLLEGVRSCLAATRPNTGSYGSYHTNVTMGDGEIRYNVKYTFTTSPPQTNWC